MGLRAQCPGSSRAHHSAAPKSLGPGVFWSFGLKVGGASVLSSVQASSCSLKAVSRLTSCLSTFSQAQARGHLVLHDGGPGLNPQVPNLGTSLGIGSCPDSPPSMSSPSIHTGGKRNADPKTQPVTPTCFTNICHLHCFL